MNWKTGLLLGILSSSLLNCKEDEKKTTTAAASTFTQVHTYMKASCGTSTCHAAGGDADTAGVYILTGTAATDYATLIAGTGLVDKTTPAGSLILLKPTGEESHTGGTLFAASSSTYSMILSWIKAGALNN